MLGVLRGTEKKFSFRGKEIIVNNKNVEVSAGFTVNYLPASEVPAAVDRILAKVNAVGPSTSLEEIAWIAQGLLGTHPFADGNGRVTKMVLDYMLLKAHLPPLPHDPQLTKDFMFKTPADYAQDMRRAYAKAGLAQ